MTYGTELVKALDKAWAAIRKNHPELGEVVLVTGRRRSRGEATLLGQHCCDTWQVTASDGGKKVSEIYVTGERLAGGAVAGMCTLLHEAAHELARVRGVKDTSNKNRYHNKAFAKLAGELGLTPPESSGGPAMGYSACTIPEDTVARYRKVIEAFPDSHVIPSPPEVKRKAPRRYAECGCGEEARIPWNRELQKRVDSGYPLTCGVCGRPFEETE